MDKKILYLIIFSIIFTISITLGIIIQSVIYYFIITWVLFLFAIWTIYFITHKKQSPTEEIKHVSIQLSENNSEKDEEQIPTENVYEGEIITEEDFIKMKHENKTWYIESNKMIENSLSNLNNLLKSKE